MRVLDSGDLRLDNVGLADDGLYHCIARNSKAMAYSAQARLRVEGEIFIVLYFHPSPNENKNPEIVMYSDSYINELAFIIQL